VEYVLATELGLIKLGIDIMMVEKKLLAEQFEEATNQKNVIRRVAGVNDIESTGEQNAQ
jgi:hypothetical protein